MNLPYPEEDDPLEELTSRAADEFMERLERGEEPDVEEVVAHHPQIAGVLRQLLPALRAMRGAAGPACDGPPACEPDRPERLGDFQIIREVGRGGMGVVYEANQLSLGRRVALKVLPFAAMLDPNRLQRFQNEARAAACLHHGNIVPIFAVGCERGVHYYAMQYIEGRNVAVLIHDARRQARLAPEDGDPSPDPDGLPTEVRPPAVAPDASTRVHAAASTERPRNPDVSFHTAARLAVQAADALHHAHQQGVLHRDVKPANVIVDAAGWLWVTDFGLAQVQSDPRLTTTGNLIGTLRYMSPEQAAGDQTVDHRTDIFSLGATLYELLALRPAFGGRDRAKVLRRVVQDEPKPLRRINPAIPADLETIVVKAMAKSPADRYPTALALADDLRRFLEDKPILAKRPSLLEKAARWSRRRRHLVAAVIGVLLLAVNGLAASTLLIAWQKAETQKALDLLQVEQQQKDHALALLKQEEAKKDAALDVAAEQRQQAQDAAWKARQVLNIFTQVSEQEIPDKPELRPVRRKLLETALGYYQEFIEQQTDDPAIQAEMVASKLRIASILEEIGRKEDALAIYEQVRAELRASTPPGMADVFRLLGGPEFGVSSLLMQPAVRKDLQLSDEQVKKLTALVPRWREGPWEHRSPADEKPEALEQACFEVLRPEQAKRLLQIVWQQRGPHAFADAEVADELGLAPDQRESVRQIEQKLRQAFTPGRWGKQRPDDLMKGARDQLLAVLTDEQSAKWKEMTGEPFRGEVRLGASEEIMAFPGFHPRPSKEHEKEHEKEHD